MNTIDIILLILIAAALVWAVSFCIRSRRNGKGCGGCCGDCSGCSKKHIDK
ncbi:MAG TPA: FeoB-associated Cys-rich membrane protein [Ruminococcus sp.]|nr:FeoB-associated Cys-rich membrane protein [Ruminococcus sp.]HRR77486.1 FeoB-associated Cys-rich membrane protein [Ruminococcus sp.]